MVSMENNNLQLAFAFKPESHVEHHLPVADPGTEIQMFFVCRGDLKKIISRQKL